MAQITYPDAIAIYQLIYYAPCLFSSIYIASKHGAMKSSGWIFLAAFCLVRIIGSSAHIATLVNPDAKTAYKIALVTSLLGLSPLLMASLGLITRAQVPIPSRQSQYTNGCRDRRPNMLRKYYSLLEQPWSTAFSLTIVRLIHLPALIALILCIVGATSAPTPADIDSQTTVHIGIILYAVVYAILALLTLGAALAQNRSHKGEALLILAVAGAMPCIFIRLLYSLLAAFAPQHTVIFNPITGSTTVALFMSVLEEMMVVLIYIAAGLKLPTVPADAADGPGGALGYRFGRGDFGTGKLGILSLGVAAVQALNSNKDVEEARQAEYERKSEVGRGQR